MTTPQSMRERLVEEFLTRFGCSGNEGLDREFLMNALTTLEVAARAEERQDAYWHAGIVRKRMMVECLEDIKERYHLAGYIDEVIEALTPTTPPNN